jgi:1-acyl-sn-glycerol-3-phosphate acyltransferase
MFVLRLIGFVFHILIGVLICATCFPWLSLTRRESITRAWSRLLVLICGLKFRFVDQSLETIQFNQTNSLSSSSSNALIVANHVSWIDIFVMNSYRTCYFVAKSDIRQWPVAGWLAAKAGTVFLVRGNQRAVRHTYEGLVHQLSSNKRVAFFPEGTTGVQGELLNFHANLFEAAIEAQVAVQPYALRYVDEHGNLHSAVNFIGEMTLLESLLLILKTKNMTAELIQLPGISSEGAHRRELAVATRKVVAQGLGMAVEE